MKRLIAALVCLVMSVPVFSGTDCYTRLLKGGSDSVVHRLNVMDVSPTYTLRSMTVTGLTNLMRRCGCQPTLRNIQCGQAIPGNDLTAICYVESDWGYFLVNRDFLDNLNVIFNRWD